MHSFFLCNIRNEGTNGEGDGGGALAHLLLMTVYNNFPQAMQLATGEGEDVGVNAFTLHDLLLKHILIQVQLFPTAALLLAPAEFHPLLPSKNKLGQQSSNSNFCRCHQSSKLNIVSIFSALTHCRER